MSDKSTGSGFAVGFILGTVIGLAIGFLYAPQPGKETRELLKERVTDVVGRVREAAAETREKAKEKLSQE